MEAMSASFIIALISRGFVNPMHSAWVDTIPLMFASCDCKHLQGDECCRPRCWLIDFSSFPSGICLIPLLVERSGTLVERRNCVQTGPGFDTLLSRRFELSTDLKGSSERFYELLLDFH
jgi:hypothetical protein